MDVTPLHRIILLIESLIRCIEAMAPPRVRILGIPLPSPATRVAAELRHIAEAIATVAATLPSRPGDESPPVSAPQAGVSAPQASAPQAPAPQALAPQAINAISAHTGPSLYPSQPDRFVPLLKRIRKKRECPLSTNARPFRYDVKTNGFQGPCPWRVEGRALAFLLNAENAEPP